MDKPNQTPLVLIVDDYAEGREICAEYLAFRGYRVATAEDGIDAIEKTRPLLPDVILMDEPCSALDPMPAASCTSTRPTPSRSPPPGDSPAPGSCAPP